MLVKYLYVVSIICDTSDRKRFIEVLNTYDIPFIAISERGVTVISTPFWRQKESRMARDIGNLELTIEELENTRRAGLLCISGGGSESWRAQM